MFRCILSSFFSNDRRQRGTYGERPGQTQLYRLLVKKKDEELEVYVGNIHKFTALPGSFNDNYAVRLTQVLRGED